MHLKGSIQVIPPTLLGHMKCCKPGYIDESVVKKQHCCIQENNTHDRSHEIRGGLINQRVGQCLNVGLVDMNAYVVKRQVRGGME